MATHELSLESKAKLRMIVEVYYDLQDVRKRTDQRIADYAEETALCECIGASEVQKLRNLGDHNVAYKKAVRDRKFSEKELKTVKDEHGTMEKFFQVATGEDAEKVKFFFAYAKALKDLEGDKKHKKVNDLGRSQESILKAQAMSEIAGHPLWVTWLSHLYGIGPCLAGGILSWINIEKCHHASNLIAYCGQSVVVEQYICPSCGATAKPEEVPGIQERLAKGLPHEAARCSCGKFYRIAGHAPRREKGKLLGYNPHCKTLCWKIGESFVKQKKNSGYGKLYDSFRLEIEAKIAANNGFCHKVHKDKEGKLINEGKCFDAHVHAMAKRAMVKVFLSHLYLKWRDLLGLPVTEPFAFGMLGHSKASLIEPIDDGKNEDDE